MQILYGRIAGADQIGIVAEALQAAVPDIAMNIIIRACGEAQEFNVPESSQDEPNDDGAPGKTWCSASVPPTKKLADRQEICDFCNCQSGHEPWPAPIAEVA